MVDLRVWMIRNGLTYVAIGKYLGGITGVGVLKMLQGDRMPTLRHKQLLEFGVPEHLMPPARDVPVGKRSKK